MARKLKVLSIDFDYFQNATADTMMKAYPDGKDLPTSLSSFVWQSHYSNQNTNEKLLKVTFPEEEYDKLINILYNQDYETKVMIVNSHKHIYDFINEEKKKSKYNGLKIVNIDTHHDMFNDNTESVDCGNWLCFIQKENPNLELTWVANPVSKEAYGIDEEKFDIIKTSIDESIDDKYDMVFICRSDNWFPPHLDEHFSKLYNTCCEIFHRVAYTKDIVKPRDISFEPCDMNDLNQIANAMNKLCKQYEEN